MANVYTVASFWFLAAVISTIIANRLRISVSLTEIIVGVSISFFAVKLGFFDQLALNNQWMTFCTGMGAILLTFLAGAELNFDMMKEKAKEVTVVGFIGFAAPFAGCFLIAYYLLGWDIRASLLGGIALSTTSMAVVYTVMLEYGFNKTEFGKGILGACFINDLGTVIALGLIFVPFTIKTLIFIIVTGAVIFFLPTITKLIIHHFAYRNAAIRAKWVIFCLLSLGTLAYWSGSEPVLPAYIMGMTLSSIMESDGHFVRRLRTLTIGFLTPLYFLRAGALVYLPAVISGVVSFTLLLAGKLSFKIFGLYPAIKQFRDNGKEKWYYTLLMSTGLTFGTISALFGLQKNIVTKAQYSLLVAVVILSAIVPTLVANKCFLPVHLMEEPILDDQAPDEKDILNKL